MAGQGAVPDAHFGNAGEGGLQGGEQFGFQLAVDLIPGIGLGHIAAHVGVEQHGVGDAIAVFAKAADGDIHIQSDVAVHHAEGHRIGRAVLVAHQLLDVEIIHPLIPARLAAEGQTVEGALEDLLEFIGAEGAVEDAGLGVLIEDVFAGLGAEFHDLALIHHHHALAVGHGDDGALADDVIVLIPAAAEAVPGLFLGLHRQHVFRQAVLIEVFFPLAGQRSAQRIQSRTNQSHNLSPFLFSLYFTAAAPYAAAWLQRNPAPGHPRSGCRDSRGRN